MIVRDIPLPKVWDKNMNYIGEIRPIKVSATLKMIPLSYASLRLPKGVSVPARGYVELFSSMGSLGFYRVRSPQDAYGDDITTAELEHAITEVGDYLVLGSYDEMMSANQAFTTIFSHYRGNRWQLGSVSALGSGEIALQVDHVRVLESLIALLEQKPDCMMSFDFSTTPWTLNVVKVGTTVAAEGRLARNVNYAKVSYDDTDLCTRAYFQVSSEEDADPGGVPAFDKNKNYSVGAFVSYSNKLYRLPNGHTKGVTWANTTKTLVKGVPTTTWQYVDADTIGTYGLSEKVVYSGGDFTGPEVLKAVGDFLNKHKEPRVSVEISAEELSSITGEPFDTFQIGKLCRLALVDYGVTIERNITGISWDNIYGSPFDITINLEEEEDTAINFIHDVDSSGGTVGGSGGGGGGGSGKAKQEAVWKEYWTKFNQTDYYFDLQAARVNQLDEILQQAGMYIDSNGVLLYAQDNERNLGSKIKVQADRISLVVEGTGPNAHIKAAQIVASINDQIGQSTVLISADVIDIDGLVTALAAKTIGVGSLEVEGDTTFKGDVYGEASIVAEDLIRTNTGLYIGNSEVKVLDASKSGNTLTITKTDGEITFSKAARLSAEYGGDNKGATATYKVTGIPSENFPSGAETTGTFTLHINSNAAWITDANGAVRARLSNPADTDAAYKRGWNACIDAATYVTRYTRSDGGGNGGDNVTHYTNKTGSGFTGVGTGWYKTALAGAYILPSKK